MAYDLNQRLVIGVASSAVFDLSESDTVFRGQGEEQYRRYQEDNLHNPLPKGMSFSFIRRLLSLNDLSSDPVGKLAKAPYEKCVELFKKARSK